MMLDNRWKDIADHIITWIDNEAITTKG